MKKTISLILSIVMCLSLTACKNTPDDDFYKEYPTGDEIVTIEIEKNPVATVKLSDGSEIVIELYYKAAPNAVANFIAFAREKVYSTMCFSEVRNNCILMTGYQDPEASAPYYVQDEIQDNDDVKLTHERGVVSMIRTSDSDTLTGQFFILTKNQKHFDNTFTAFGKFTRGNALCAAVKYHYAILVKSHKRSATVFKYLYAISKFNFKAEVILCNYALYFN